MYACYCKFRQCNGQKLKWSTRAYHKEQDRKAPATSNLQPSQTSTPSTSTPNPLPTTAPLPAPRPSTPPNSSQLLSPQTPPNNFPAPEPLTPRQRRLSDTSRIAELDARAQAEERGRLYMESVMHSPAAPQPEDDIGDMWDDFLGEVEQEMGGATEARNEGDGDVFMGDAGAAESPDRDTSANSGASASEESASFVDPGDPPILDENFPDPFQPSDVTKHSPSITTADTPTHLFILYLLVSWLHTHFHLPFLACNMVLTVGLTIFRALGAVPTPDMPIYTTLASITSHLGVEPTFLALPVCPTCLEVYPATIEPDALCTHCSCALFRARCRLDRRRGSRPATEADPEENRRPHLQFPTKTIESQLCDMLAVPGMEDTLERWRKKPRTAGKMTDNFDGDICQTLPGADGRPFFENPRPSTAGQPEELRIGLTLGVDWFSYLRSQISPSHTSGPMSFNIINLPEYLRYRTSNLLLSGILPGPKEQNPDQVQRFMRVFVNELIRLWRHGFIAKTPKHPVGILVRVILVCVICDKPAAHKMGGFRSHSHTIFCTWCWIRQSDKATAAAFEKDAFCSRTHAEQLRYAQQYAKLDSKSARDDFVKKYASRWFELARLPYFDICRMIVIDPMHNLLLGLVKTHFYHIWIQQKVLRKTKELRRFHNILSQLQIPAYLGRLPSLMGAPAGGSLTADQWLVAAAIVCPIAIPQIWDEYCTGDPEEIQLRRIGEIKQAIEKKKAAAAAARKERAAAAQAAAANSAPKRSTRKRQRTARSLFAYPEMPGDDPEEDEIPDAGAVEDDTDIFEGADDEENDEADARASPNLHPDDPGNFFKLTLALRLLLAREITPTEIDTADGLLRAYCVEVLKLYGPDMMRPNHHYCTHITECIRDFGPLHGFWTFLFERINKVLKSYNSSNHSGGELETSFFREFHRTIQQSRVMASSFATGDGLVQASVSAMYRATADDRGTVQALARDLDQASADGGLSFQLAPPPSGCTQGHLQPALYSKLLPHLQKMLPFPIRSHIVLGPEVPLLTPVIFFDYVVISQHRYYASNRHNNVANSLIAVSSPDNPGSIQVGQLENIIVLNQIRLGRILRFGHVRWLIPAQIPDIAKSVFAKSASTTTMIWQFDEYDTSLNTIIALDTIQSHVIRTEAMILGCKYWITITPG